jgi:hypothetical protein
MMPDERDRDMDFFHVMSGVLEQEIKMLVKAALGNKTRLIMIGSELMRHTEETWIIFLQDNKTVRQMMRNVLDRMDAIDEEAASTEQKKGP